MGIYDREYYRREGPSFLGSISERGKVCKWLIAINVAFFVAQIASDKVTGWLDVRTGRPLTPLTDEEVLKNSTAAQDYREMSPEKQRRFVEQSRPDIEELRQKLEQEYGSGVLQGQVWRLLTYAFLHSTDQSIPWHIIFNMLFLWWFGHEMEELYGPREFLTFYLVAAFLGGIAFFLWQWSQGDPIPCVALRVR